MNNRLFTQNDALPGFSDELMLLILSEPTDHELMQASLVSRDFYRLINDDALWKVRFIKSFGKGLLVSNDDVKAQFIAATLYQRGKAQTRPDLAQPIFISLYRLVKLHQGKLWANYYLANLHLHGYGTQKSVEYGKHLLLECVKSAHPAAIHDFITKFPEDLQRLTQVEFDYYNHLLLAAYHRGAKHFSLSLAALFQAGVNGATNLVMESSWLERAIDARLQSAIERYVDIKIQQQPDRLPSAIINELIVQHAEKPTLLGDLQYCLALAHSEEGDLVSSRLTLLRATELHSVKALVDMATLYREEAAELHDARHREMLNMLALDYYKSGLRRNHVACTQAYFDLMVDHIEKNRGKYEPLIESLRDAFAQGNPIAAILIHQLHASISGFSSIGEDSQMMLWLQLAAQCGKPGAVAEIIKLANGDKPSVFALCALAVIHQFGILGSEKFQPEPQLAGKCLEKACKLNFDEVTDYFATGQALALLSTQTIEIMREHMQAFVVKYIDCKLF